MVTARVAAGVAFMPFHFGGYWQGKDLRVEISEGQRSIRARRSVEHVIGTYGYDLVTQMQETKVTLCRIEAA